MGEVVAFPMQKKNYECVYTTQSILVVGGNRNDLAGPKNKTLFSNFPSVFFPNMNHI